MLTFKDDKAVADAFAEIGDLVVKMFGVSLTQVRVADSARTFSMSYRNMPKRGEAPPTAAIRSSTGTSRSRDTEPTFELEFLGGVEYRLRNTSNIPATGVAFEVPDGYKVVGYEGVIQVDLDPAQSDTFMMSPAPYDEIQSLGEIQIACEQLDAPSFIPVPSS